MTEEIIGTSGHLCVSRPSFFSKYLLFFCRCIQVKYLITASVLTFGLLVLFAPSFAYAFPGTLPLKVSSDNRTLVYKNDVAYFPIIDTLWMLPYNSKADIRTILDDRKQKGFNGIQMMMIGYRQEGKANFYGHKPFANGDLANPRTVSGPDNDYWDLVEFILRETKARNMHCWIVPAWENGYHDEINASKARTYAEFFVGRFPKGTYSHVVWILGGDRAASKHVKAPWIAMGRKIKSLGDNRLLTYHPTGSTLTTQYFAKTELDWLDFHMIQSGHPQWNSAISAVALFRNRENIRSITRQTCN